MSGLFACLLKKEWLDAVRDKRAFTAAMMIAFVGPVMIAISIMISVNKIQTQEPFYIQLEGAEQFPSLVDALKAKAILTDIPPQKEADFSVTISPEFTTELNKGEPAEIVIRGDFSEQTTQIRLKRFKRVLTAFASELGAMRLMARGISPAVVNPFKIIEQDTSSAQSRAGMILKMIATFVLMSVFVASTNVAIDCSAGERERNSLEFLLAQPVKPLSLVMAKTLNTSFFSLVGAALTLLMMGIVIAYLPFHKLGLTINFSVEMGLIIWLVMVPLAIFAATFQLITSFKSKTFKEAQSYISMTIILPMMVPMMLTMANVEHPALEWLPLTGQNAFIADMVKGEAVNMMGLLLSSMSTLSLAALFIWLMARGLKTEKMILGL